jgi:hypothetical protein
MVCGAPVVFSLRKIITWPIRNRIDQKILMNIEYEHIKMAKTQAYIRNI